MPPSLREDCRKAEDILKSFMEPVRGGLDGVRTILRRPSQPLPRQDKSHLTYEWQVIPRDVISRAKGFCIFTVVKAAIIFSARAGSGIVIARLPGGGTSCPLSVSLESIRAQRARRIGWSAPSAIRTGGMGFGGQGGVGAFRSGPSEPIRALIQSSTFQKKPSSSLSSTANLH